MAAAGAGLWKLESDDAWHTYDTVRKWDPDRSRDPLFFSGVPNDAELEPSGAVPHRLGGASEDGGVALFTKGRKSFLSSTVVTISSSQVFSVQPASRNRERSRRVRFMKGLRLLTLPLSHIAVELVARVSETRDIDPVGS